MMIRLISCIALAAALAACEAPQAEYSSVEAPRQTRVDYHRYTYTASFGAGHNELAPTEAKKLDAFLGASEVTANDPVYLEAPVNDKAAAARVSALARDLTRKGYAVATIPAARDAIAANSLLVVVERYTVTPPACPNWTASPSENHENTVSSNFGCANLTNLDLMVADPRDLVIGQQMGGEPADHAGLAIQRYREGKTAPLPNVSAGTTYNVNVNASGGSSGGPGGGAGTPGTGQ
jgi:pilus assembly protein CpaD